MRRRVDQRTRTTLDLGVVALAVLVLCDLLHVGLPVDFRVCQSMVSLIAYSRTNIDTDMDTDTKS